jgi:hypothetical protein
MTKDGWLRCDSVERGMFSDELAVVISRSNGAKESYFVPSSTVEAPRSRVRVSLQEGDSVWWATLPTPERTTIPVSRNRIEV